MARQNLKPLPPSEPNLSVCGVCCLGARAQLALAAGAADQLASQAGQLERTRYFDRLFKHEKSILAPSLWTDGIARVPDIWARTTRLATGYYTLIGENNGAWVAWLLLAVFVVLAAAGYHACRMLAHRVRAGKAPSGELAKLIRVVAVPIGYALVAVVATTVFGLLLFELGARVHSDGTALFGLRHHDGDVRLHPRPGQIHPVADTAGLANSQPVNASRTEVAQPADDFVSGHGGSATCQQ